MSIESVFNSSVDYYDDWMKKALPNFTDLFQTAQELVTFDPQSPIDVLDLGAGTGLFSKHIFDKFPNAHFVLYDLADKLLEVAKERFDKQKDRFKYAIGDYRNLKTDTDFDLVISSLSIHHLTDIEKQSLFENIYKVLRNPGIFINVDQIKGQTSYIKNLYWSHWLNQVQQREPSEKRIRESIERRKYDQDALMTDQLQWMTAAGFQNVDCVYKNFFVGVFFGMKA